MSADIETIPPRTYFWSNWKFNWDWCKSCKCDLRVVVPIFQRFKPKSIKFGFKRDYLISREGIVQLIHIFLGLLSIICIAIGYRHKGVLYWGVYDLIQLFMALICFCFILSTLLLIAITTIQEPDIQKTPIFRLGALVFFINAGILLFLGFICGLTRFCLEMAKFRHRKSLKMTLGLLDEYQTGLYNEGGMIIAFIISFANCCLYFVGAWFQWNRITILSKPP